MYKTGKQPCPMCHSTNIGIHEELESVSLFFRRKDKGNNIDVSEQIELDYFYCNDCGYVMLFKRDLKK